MRSIGFRIAGCAIVALLAPWAMAACGSSGLAGSTTWRDGGRDDGSDGGSESPSAKSDASRGILLPPLGADAALPSATAFADVNVPADFTQPVDLPPPATTIAGDRTSLVGSWVQLALDGSVCTPATAPLSLQDTSCLYLDIQQDDAGAVEGTIHADPGPGLNTGTPVIRGPFPPATDPTVSYPPAVSPSDYFYAELLLPNVDYRLLDGVVASGSFTFWFSPLDLWSTWCALQTPSAWNVGGQIKYRCVPQTATPTNTDVGKFDLCTSAEDGPQCTSATGVIEPCACLGDGGMFNWSLPGCGRTVCACSATQCRADLRSSQMDEALTLQGGKLVDGAGFTFQRAAQ